MQDMLQAGPTYCGVTQYASLHELGSTASLLLMQQQQQQFPSCQLAAAAVPFVQGLKLQGNPLPSLSALPCLFLGYPVAIKGYPLLSCIPVVCV